MNGAAPARGFTVIEVLVAVGLFGILLVAMSSLFLATTLVGATDRTSTDATVVSQEEFEILRGMNYISIPGGTRPCLARTTVAGRTYTCSRTVELNPIIDEDPEPNMKRITVTLTWQVGGRTRTYVARTVYADVER